MYYATGSTLSYVGLVARRLPRLQCQWIHSKSSTVSTMAKATVAERKQPTMSFREMPGPTMMESYKKYRNEGVGNHHLIQVDLFEKYGPTFKLKMPGRIMVCTCYPDDIEKVFRAEGYPANRGDDILVGTMSYYRKKRFELGLIGNDESWHVHRSAVGSKVLRPVALKPFVSDLCSVSDDTVASFQEGHNRDVHSELLKWSTESIGVVAFGRRIGLNTATPNKMALDFVQAVCSLLAIEAKLQFSFPFHKYFETPTLKHLYSCVDIVWNTTDYYIQKEKQDRTTSESVVRQLINEEKLSQDQIIHITTVIFSGGVDSTSNATLNLLYFLSEFPNAQQKLYEEIEQTLPNAEVPTHNHVNNMPYLRAAIKESARLQPTAPNTVRQLKEPIILSGYEVPPETPIIMSFMASPSMNKKCFGDDFEQFNPDRWLRSAAKKPPPFAWVRFGFGPRMCLGKRVAELEMALFLIRLLQKYEIEGRRPEDDKMTWKFELLLNAAKPFNMNLKTRK